MLISAETSSRSGVLSREDIRLLDKRGNVDRSHIFVALTQPMH